MRRIRSPKRGSARRRSQHGCAFRTPGTTRCIVTTGGCFTAGSATTSRGAAGTRALACRWNAAAELAREVTTAHEGAVAATGSEGSASAGDRHTASATLRQNGDYWIVSDGKTTGHLKDMKGLHYIRQLLLHPGQELHLLDLIGRGLEAGDQRAARNPAQTPAFPSSMRRLRVRAAAA
jgi:hypothetical protein